MVRSGPLLLAGVLCLDLAHRGSVDAFLSSPLLLRRPPLARDRPVACAQGVRLPSTPGARTRSGLLSAKALFGGASEEINVNVPTIFPNADRIVAIGDVHGDVDALAGCIKLAGLMDENQNWTGNTTQLVQLGDILDRGDTEKGCMDLLFKLRAQAKEAGGAVHILLGNHEVMNVDLDFRYVTQNAWEGWDEPVKSGSVRLDIKASLAAVGFPSYMKPRVQAFRPGGSEAKRLSVMPVAIQIGDTVLVHGGLRKRHLKYGLQKMNDEMYAWLEGPPTFKSMDKPEIIDDSDSPIWARLYSVPTPKLSAEKELEDVLKTLNARRMVVGHTPQLRGINAFVTDGGYEVWRTDTGMSSGMMSGPLEVLEILGDGTVHVLTEGGLVPAQLRMPEVEGEFMDVCDIDTGLCTDAPQETAELLPDSVGKTTVTAGPGEVVVSVKEPSERPTQELSPQNQAEVQKLRTFDDESLPVDKRLTVLVERLIVDAIQRQDEGLTKKTVKDMLRKVVGAQIVEDKNEYISAEVDRIVASDVANLVAKYMSAEREGSRV